MHRYDELEKLYYKKKYQKIFFIISVFLVIIVLLLFFCKHQHKPAKKIIFHPTKIKIKKPLTMQNKEINKTTKKIKEKKLKSKKKLSLKTVQAITFVLPDINKTKETTINKASQIKKDTSTKQNLKEVNNTKSAKHNFNNIHIVETSIENINILIKKYNQNPNYDLAMMISKFFFNENKLKKAQIWALKANEINPERVESWIVFANILIKEKKINKAKEILKTYLNSYGQNDIIEKKLRSINE